MRALAFLLLSACASAKPSIAFVDVTVISMLGEGADAAQTVIVEDGVIRAVGPSIEVPSGATRIDGRGRFLLPGFADMHVHLPLEPSPELEKMLESALAQGVTVIRGMQGAPHQLEARSRLSHRPLPRLVLAGPPVGEALTPEQARSLVRAQKEAGYDAVKILGGIDLAAYRAITAAGRELGMPVCGHVPKEIGIEAALAERQASIEHAMGYDGDLDDLARRTREAGIYNCPTLSFFASQPDPSVLEKRASAVAALARAGAPLLIGTDGFTYVEEMRQLAKAGATPEQILYAATRGAAEYLGDAKSGAIAAGMRADLVLLEKNPLENIEHAADPLGVMVRGIWVPIRE